jgi:hypothetical protein
MKPLTLGDTVVVRAVTFVEYHDDDKRVVQRVEYRTFVAWVVGQRVKHLGTYSKAGHYGAPGEEEYEPPYLVIEGTVILWVVRVGLRNEELLVADDDLTKVEAAVPPQLGPRPEKQR